MSSSGRERHGSWVSDGPAVVVEVPSYSELKRSTGEDAGAWRFARAA